MGDRIHGFEKRMMLSEEQKNEIRQTMLDEQRNLFICFAGEVLFTVSLVLPAMGNPPNDVVPGFVCLLIGIYFYPSNLALLLSPMICRSTNAGLRTFIGIFLLMSCFYAFVTVTINGMQEPRAGFWLWLSAFVVSAIGLLIPVRSSAD